MTTTTRILSLDPGLAKTGYAVLDDLPIGEGVLIDQGTLSPGRAGTQPERIEVLCFELANLLDVHEPAVILIEWDSGHVNIRRHKGGGSGLAVHGAVTAALWREALYWARRRKGVAVVTIPEHDWTRGIPKEDRAVAVAQMFPGYDLGQDSGFNIADAIGLAVWHARERMIETMKAETP